MKVVDVHTHMLNQDYLALLKKHGGGYKVRKVVGGQTGIFKDGAPFMTLMPGMFDYEVRLQAMDAGRRRYRHRHADQPQRLLGLGKDEPAGCQVDQRRHGREAAALS